MVFLFELILGVFFALLVVGIIGAVVGSKDEGWAFSFPLVLLFFGAIWAMSSWVYPFGPTIYGVYWLPFFLISLFLLFFVLALPPVRGLERPLPEHSEQAQIIEEAKKAEEGWGFGLLAWIFILAVVGMVWAANYWYEPTAYMAVAP